MLITLQLMPIFHDNNRIFVLFPGYSCSGEPCNRCREIINTECKEEVSQYGEMTLHLLLVQTKPQKVCSLWCNGIESVVGKKYVGSVVICTACEMAIVWIENQLRETKRRSWYCNMLTRTELYSRNTSSISAMWSTSQADEQCEVVILLTGSGSGSLRVETENSPWQQMLSPV